MSAIAIHDANPYAFVVELATALRAAGHDVTFFSCPQLQGGRDPGLHDAVLSGVDVEPVSLPFPFPRYRLPRRVAAELVYGLLLARAVRRAGVDALLTTNSPLIGVFVASWQLRRRGVRVVDWHQDLVGEGSRVVLGDRGPVLGRIASMLMSRVERRLVRDAAGVIAISEWFADVLEPWASERSVVVPNWAPLAQIPARERANAWAAMSGLDDGPVVLYTGTLGLKHDVSQLLAVARAIDGDSGHLVVVSEGDAADDLALRAASGGVTNLRVLPYQPYEDYADVLASADVLIVTLTEGASSFSIPSKVTSYLCAKRPVVAAMDAANPAAQMLMESGSGIVVRPDDPDGFGAAVRSLLRDPARRAAMGAAGRRFAEHRFDVRRVLDEFERVLEVRGAGDRPQLASGPEKRPDL